MRLVMDEISSHRYLMNDKGSSSNRLCFTLQPLNLKKPVAFQGWTV